jgi:GNAT superfamily N-acetyltransferase
MQLKEVKNKADWKAFHQVSHYIFARDPHWIAPLESDVEKVFDPNFNKAFDGGGEAKQWVLYNEQGKGIGRIAAFIDAARNAQKETKEGGIGFFDCINDDAAATLLFDVAENFLTERGINVIHALVNFGERDKFWGLLIKGWYKPLYHENYHPPYYQRFLKARGYQPQEQIFTFGGKVEDLAFDRLAAITARVRERYGIQSRKFNIKDLAGEGEHMATVYNAAFAHMPHFKPMEGAQITKMLKQMKPVMDPCLTCIAFADDQAIGFCALMPDLNQSLAFSKGKLKWWKFPRFLYNLKKGHPKIVKGVAFGIHPDYQRKGVFSEMVDYLASVDNGHNPKTYDTLGLATIRGNNLAMLKTVSAALNVNVERVHLSFVRIFEGGVYEPYGETDITAVPLGEVPDESVYPKA